MIYPALIQDPTLKILNVFFFDFTQTLSNLGDIVNDVHYIEWLILLSVLGMICANSEHFIYYTWNTEKVNVSNNLRYIKYFT